MDRHSREQTRWFFHQLAVVALGVVVYFGVRGLTESRPAVADRHGLDVLALERRIGLAHEHSVQHLLVGRDWLTTAANWVYIWGHWPVITVVLVWLALRHRETYLRLRNAMLLSGLVGLVVFALYPVSPPRLLDVGLIDTVSERSGAYRVLQPPAFVNQYAAVPSLHVGWDLILGLAVASAASSSLLRWAGRTMPVLMALAVVLTANHYVVDAVLGALLALAGWVSAGWWQARAGRTRDQAQHQVLALEPYPRAPSAPSPRASVENATTAQSTACRRGG